MSGEGLGVTEAAERTASELRDLHELADRYAKAFDAGDAVAWADCFEADGEFASVTGTVCRGRQQLLAFATELLRTWSGQGITSRHEWFDLKVIERIVGPTGVRWRCTSRGSVYFERGGHPSEPAMRTAYADTIVRSGAATRFESRVSTPRTTA